MKPEKKSNGAIVGLVVIIVILAVGGIYIWMLNKNASEKVQTGAITSQDSAALDALDADVQAADTSTGVDVNSVH